MIITIGTTSDDKRKLSKNFAGTDITVQLKQPCDILHPAFILNYNAEYLSANYLYCAELGRYYFIDNIILSSGHRIELHCTVDVLMSYRNQISYLNCVITRQQNYGLTLIPDSELVVQNYSPVQVIAFPASFTTMYGTYVLQVLGGN